MKKLLSVLLSSIIVFSSFVIAFSVDVGAASKVPTIKIVTENNNGNSLEKADGYVNATIELNDTDGSALSDSVIVKVRGNSTAMTAKKSFTFKFEKKKDVFSMGKGKKWALLANAFDPTLLRNYVTFELAEELGLEYTSKQRIAELWMDGVFKGCYTLMEPVQEGKDRVDIDIESNGGLKDFMIELEASRVDEDVTYFRAGNLRFGISEPDEPTDEQAEYVSKTVNDLINVMKSGTEAEIEAVIDVQSFAKFYLLNELIKPLDLNFSSVFFYYKDGKLFAGPPWDYDLTAGNINKDFSSNAADAYKPDGLYANSKNLFAFLCKYTWFNDIVKDIYRKHYTYLENIYIDGGMIDSLADEYSESFSRNYNEAGWNISRYLINVHKIPFATYEENLSYFKNWWKQRNEWLFTEFGFTEDNLYTIGDTNGDGTVNVSDATLIQKMIVDLEPENEQKVVRGNVNGNELDVTDATLIQRWIVGLENNTLIGKRAIY